MKKLLVACEFSGVVRDAFAAKGWDAWSCDIVPCERGGNHIQGDVLDVIYNDWDLMIAHPPCTYLCSSGLHWTTRGLRDRKLTEDALKFVRTLMNAPIPCIAIENPTGCISTRIRKPDQRIQPYEFGDDASKCTCLWLKNLPPLVSYPSERFNGRVVEWPRGSGRIVERWSNQTDSGQNRLGPDESRGAERARTYEGIAAAMAEQWNNPVPICTTQSWW